MDTPETEKNKIDLEEFKLTTLKFDIKAIIAFDGDTPVLLGAFPEDTSDAANLLSSAASYGYKNVQSVKTSLLIPLLTEE